MSYLLDPPLPRFPAPETPHRTCGGSTGALRGSWRRMVQTIGAGTRQPHAESPLACPRSSHPFFPVSEEAGQESIALGRLRQAAAFNKWQVACLPYSNLHSLCLGGTAYLLCGEKRVGISSWPQPSKALGTERHLIALHGSSLWKVHV